MKKETNWKRIGGGKVGGGERERERRGGGVLMGQRQRQREAETGRGAFPSELLDGPATDWRPRNGKWGKWKGSPSIKRRRKKSLCHSDLLFFCPLYIFCPVYFLPVFARLSDHAKLSYMSPCLFELHPRRKKRGETPVGYTCTTEIKTKAGTEGLRDRGR